MVNLIASPNRVLQFGYEGEDNVTQIIFNYDESWLSYGDGEFKVRVLRPGDKEAYNATDVVDNRSLMTLVMTVTNIELSKKGKGELQLVYICHDVVKKSEIYTFVVRRAIDSEVISPPKGNVIAEVEESLAEIKDDIGDLTELTTTDKSSLVGAINEVYERSSGQSIVVDSELSTESENPVQNKAVMGAFNEAAQRLFRDELAISDNSDSISNLWEHKASTDTATQSSNGLMSAQDKTKLDGLGDSGVSDVQVNGASIVTDGVAEIPIAKGTNLGLVSTYPSQTGLSINNSGIISTYSAASITVKGGTNANLPLVPSAQHVATFYGLAKVAGHDEKNSTLPVGTYTEEAKSAIHDMLGIGVARELREYSDLGEDMSEIEIPLPERYEKVWFRFMCRINNEANDLANADTNLLAFLGNTSSFSHTNNPSIYGRVYIRQRDAFMYKGWFIVDFPFVERFSTSTSYSSSVWSATSSVQSHGGSYIEEVARLTSYPTSLYIRPYETNKGYLFKADSKLGVYVK